MSATRDLTTVETERAGQIREAHEACLTATRSSVEHAYRVGELLTEVKTAVGHGSYAPWLRANCPFSARTAQVYMRIVKAFPNASAAADYGTIEKAVKAVARRREIDNGANEGQAPSTAIPESTTDPQTNDEPLADVADECSRIWHQFEQARERLTKAQQARDETRHELQTLLAEHAADDEALHKLAERVSLPFAKLKKVRGTVIEHES
jgi:hypothetical protein